MVLLTVLYKLINQIIKQTVAIAALLGSLLRNLTHKNRFIQGILSTGKSASRHTQFAFVVAAI